MQPPSLGNLRCQFLLWQLQRVDLGEPRMPERRGRREALLRVAREEAAQDLESFLGQLRLREELAQVVVPMHVQLRHPHRGERRGREPWPRGAVVRHAEHVEDGAELPVVVEPLEQRPPAVADPRFVFWGGSSLFFFLQPPFLLPPSFLSSSSPSFLPLFSMVFWGVGGLEPPQPPCRSAPACYVPRLKCGR